jgi:hypothetical protein
MSIAGALLAALVATAAEPCATDRTATLYLGRAWTGHPGGVGPRAWARFLADEVAPRAGGWTALRARGGWTDESGRLRTEPTWVLQVAYAGGGGFDPAAVARAYAARFEQASVLVVVGEGCGALVGR